jgi:hypothetical protein
MVWRKPIRNHHVDTIIPASESMYWTPFPQRKLDLVAKAFESLPRGWEGNCTSLNMENHIDVRRRSLHGEASMREVQLNH